MKLQGLKSRYVPIQSKVAAKIVTQRRYRDYLMAMKSISWMRRDDHYVPDKFAKERGRRGKCKAWFIDPGQCQHITSAGVVRLRLSAWFCGAIGSVFEWWFGIHKPWVASVSRIIRQSLGCVTALPVGRASVAALCRSDQAARTVQSILSAFRGREDTGVGFNRCRCYHRLTGLQKEFRDYLRVGGKALCEVDMHATFVCALIKEFATGDERERLVGMVVSGDFYGEFAELVGWNGLEVKRDFQRHVTFTNGCHKSKLWIAFKKHFPQTARRLGKFRDRGRVIKSIRVKNKTTGRHYRKDTTLGQSELSDRLTRVEESIFLERALLRLGNKGVNAIPIHDCLMVTPDHVEETKRAIEDAAQEVLGFTPKVKVTYRGKV